MVAFVSKRGKELQLAIGQRGFNLGAGLQCTQHFERIDSGQRQFRRNIVANAGQAQYANLQFLVCGLYRQQIGLAEMLQTQTSILRATTCLTASEWMANWLRMAVRMKSVRLA